MKQLDKKNHNSGLKKSKKSAIWWDYALFVWKAKLNVFWNFFVWSGPKAPSASAPLHSKKFQKMLILAFEVIVQLPKHTFEIPLFFFNFRALLNNNIFFKSKPKCSNFDHLWAKIRKKNNRMWNESEKNHNNSGFLNFFWNGLVPKGPVAWW